MKCETDRPSRSSGDPSSDPQPDATPELPPDDVFHILQTNRRRDVISYLLDEDEPVKMGHLAEVIAAKEHGTTVAQLTSTQRQRVYIPLYQTHLPKLDEKGVIDYNKSRGIVRPADRLELFRPYLEAAHTHTDADRSERGSDDALGHRVGSEYYVTAIGASAALLAASVVGLALLPDLALAALITTLFVLATVATTLSDSRSSTGSEGIPPIR